MNYGGYFCQNLLKNSSRNHKKYFDPCCPVESVSTTRCPPCFTPGFHLHITFRYAGMVNQSGLCRRCSKPLLPNKEIIESGPNDEEGEINTLACVVTRLGGLDSDFFLGGGQGEGENLIISNLIFAWLIMTPGINVSGI